MQSQHIEFLELLNGQVQYVVPRWQRRYRWGEADIKRLVEDLVTVADRGDGAAHYGGTLLTFPEPGAAGVVKTIRVVDGQQRLTTVSILLACIADYLGPDGECGDWTAQLIRDDRLTNPGKPKEKRRKLRLQDGDEEEYRRVLDDEVAGSGPVAQAWRVARRLVRSHGAECLLKGLTAFRVVSIGLGESDDPQQIFESLNATGRPLTESEKVKNWLLMGLRDEQQQELYESHWLKIERVLQARDTTEPIDLFLRDLLRWRTGEIHGIDQVYEGLRRWAVGHGHAADRPALCRDLARLATLYGILTGMTGEHGDREVERELRHLRAMGIDIHRPLTLRLLDDASGDATGMTNAELAKTLAGIATWTTRLWVADRATAGMNKAVVELAHAPGPRNGEDVAEYWYARIRRLRNTRVGVPNDQEVAEGIRTRKAYGGSASRSSFAVLCALMEAERPDEAPSRNRLTIEHVMPQKLTKSWTRTLGDDAESIHGRHCDRLPNLTLSGDSTNPSMASGTFDEKREVYRNSPIGMTRRIADEADWDVGALERRAADLARQVLCRWPWPDQGTASPIDSAIRWRIHDSPWHTENTASQLVLNVAGALLSRDPANAERLAGDSLSSNVHPATLYPPGSTAGTLTMYAIPGHEWFVLYPYDNRDACAERCRKMGDRCGVRVDVELDGANSLQAFWKFLKQHAGGVPGQVDSWRGPNQWTVRVNSLGDRIGIYVGDERHSVYIRAGESERSDERATRMRRYSRMIGEQMGDQELAANPEKHVKEGRTVPVQRRWSRDDEDEWPEAAQWIVEQCDRLRILAVAAVQDTDLGSATSPPP